MSEERPFRPPTAGSSLASVAELEAYGASIMKELDTAEAELNSPDNRPFAGLGAEVMADVARLRSEQFDMFRSHVEIEQQYKVASAVADDNDVRKMSFSGIADTMREKESATGVLLNRLALFDSNLRSVIAKFESPVGGGDDAPVRSASATDEANATMPSPSQGVDGRPMQSSAHSQGLQTPSTPTFDPAVAATSTDHSSTPSSFSTPPR